MLMVLTNEQVIESALHDTTNALEALGKATQALAQIQKDLNVLRAAAKQADQQTPEVGMSRTEHN